MNIYKNFIATNDCDKIHKLLLSYEFPWYYHPYQATLKDNFFLGHTFFKDGEINSEKISYLEPILNKLKPKKILNIRANFLKRSSKCSWHVDEFTKDLSHKTAIYYVNTNNGYTEFENKKVKCIKNQIVIFDAHLKHRAKGQTTNNERMVINFNYEFI
jgi:hypothetical protein